MKFFALKNFLLILICSAMLVLTCSCKWNGDVSSDSHVHNYIEAVTKPTCESDGYTTHSCKCGKSYVDGYISPLGHDYSNQDGTCVRCGELNPLLQPSKGIIYTISEDGKAYTVTGYEGEETRIAIASIYEGIPVTAIGGKAFINSTITNIIIPESVTEIGSYAFWQSALTEVDIPDTVTVLGVSAFSNCKSLLSVTVGNGVGVISRDAFSDCDALRTVTLKDGITEIGVDAFDSCEALYRISLPDTLTKISTHAFSGCQNLTSVTLGEQLLTVEASAFYRCGSLYEVINKSRLSLEIGAESNGFVAAYAIVLTDKEGGKIYRQEAGIEYFEQDRFLFKKQDDKYTLISYLGERFDVTLPQAVRESSYSLYRAKGFIQVTVPGELVAVSEQAFALCLSVKRVTLLDGVEVISSSAFQSCSGLTEVVIPATLTSVEAQAFYGCTALSAVYYMGNANDWSNITVAAHNDLLTAATIYYYSEFKPIEEGNFWHYDDNGEIVKW